MVESTAFKCGSKIRRIVDKSNGGKTIKSSAKAKEENRMEKRSSERNAVLLSRRRRHKTVHFTESPVNEFGTRIDGDVGRSTSCCQNENRGSVVSLPDEFDNHVQQLFTFIGSVLSSWDNSDNEDSEIACQTTTTSTSVSISVNRTATTTTSRNASSLYTARNRKRQRDVLHFLLYSSQSKFNIDENVGCHIYRHRHWKMASGTCNALFLKKVGKFFVPTSIVNPF